MSEDFERFLADKEQELLEAKALDEQRKRLQKIDNFIRFMINLIIGALVLAIFVVLLFNLL